MPHVLAGRDLIGIAQTGTGKTAAFVLPLLELLGRAPQHARRTPRVLIVAPTRELAAQIDESVRTFAKHLRLRCVTIFGGVGETPQIQAVRRGVDILVATPGRLLDLMNQRHISLSDVKFVVLDEADRMLDMGFLPQIRKVIAALPKERQTLLFSATLSKDIERIASEMLRNPEIVEIGRRTNPADTVEQALYPVSKSRKIDLLLHLLRDKNLDSVLVFSRTKHGADKIARKLMAARIPTATLHSNRSQGQRTAALAAFRDGRVRVLVATDIAARGIDVAGISHVVNFDFPPQPEDYVHRIGRTGRAEAVGDAISFVTPEDEANVRALEKQIRKAVPRRRAEGFDYTEAQPLQSYHPQQQRTHPAPQGRAARQSSSIRRSSSSR
ncbi:MAG TPA: DEAD/DEAH box helicase [Thermoanaerobaculia bacterium]|nr:DEAD/DEAH box helicase [Thermoanaerobaculia bacterium]